MTGGDEASDATGALLREEGTARHMAGKAILLATDMLMTAPPQVFSHLPVLSPEAWPTGTDPLSGQLNHSQEPRQQMIGAGCWGSNG